MYGQALVEQEKKLMMKKLELSAKSEELESHKLLNQKATETLYERD